MPHSIPRLSCNSGEAPSSCPCLNPAGERHRLVHQGAAGQVQVRQGVHYSPLTSFVVCSMPLGCFVKDCCKKVLSTGYGA